MRVKMPTAENDIDIRSWYQDISYYRYLSDCNPFRIKNSAIEKEKDYFVAAFHNKRSEKYANHDNPEKFFSSSERSRLTFHIMNKTQYGSNDTDIGIYNLQREEIIIDAYPLHDGQPLQNFHNEPTSERQKLQVEWASPRKIFKYQPIPAIKTYFGEKVALYFAWLGFYTTFLVPAAIIGIISFFYGVISSWGDESVKEICDQPTNQNGTYLFYMCPLCDRLCSYYLLQTDGCLYSRVTNFFDNESTLFFTIVMSFWAIIYMEFWKRKQVSLAYKWHTFDFEKEEELPRPEFEIRASNSLRKNPVTNKWEPYMPPEERASRIMGAFSVVLFFIGIICSAIVGVVVFRAALYAVLVQQDAGSVRSRSKTIVAVTAAIINLIAIELLKYVYRYIAIWLTQWENPRTNTDYTDSFTMKMFWFQFFNTYSSIFYVAFFKNATFTGTPGQYNRFTNTKFRLEGCSVQGCFLELTIQLSIIMIGEQILNNTQEIMIPFLKRKWNYWKSHCLNRNYKNTESRSQWELDFECEMQQQDTLFSQYSEIVLQYGLVTMFVAAFPLAPLFALLNNLVEIRVDAYNFIHNFRRPIAEKVEDIGAWYGILVTMTQLSTIVNGLVFSFTSDLIPRLVYIHGYSKTGTAAGFMDFRLSKFNVSDFNDLERPDNATLDVPIAQPVCRYPGFREQQTPYNLKPEYWVILSARLAFVLVFVVAVTTLKALVMYIIPDVPKDLELKIRREKILAAEIEQTKPKKFWSNTQGSERKLEKRAICSKDVSHMVDKNTEAEQDYINIIRPNRNLYK